MHAALVPGQMFGDILRRGKILLTTSLHGKTLNYRIHLIQNGFPRPFLVGYAQSPERNAKRPVRSSCRFWQLDYFSKREAIPVIGPCFLDVNYDISYSQYRLRNRGLALHRPSRKNTNDAVMTAIADYYREYAQFLAEVILDEPKPRLNDQHRPFLLP